MVECDNLIVVTTDDTSEAIPLPPASPERKTKMLFKPRSIAISQKTTAMHLALPTISVIPATPNADISDPLANAVVLESDIDDPLGAQLQHEIVVNSEGREYLAMDYPDEMDESGDLSPEGDNAQAEQSAEQLEEGEIEEEKKSKEGDACDKLKPSAHTIFALDMLVSVIGDFFGQKDVLLERR